MSFVYIKFETCVKETAGAYLVKPWGSDDCVWLPKKCCFINYNYTKGFGLKIPSWLAREKGYKFEAYEAEVKGEYHKPEHIEPVYNQDAIDELKF